MAPKNPYEHRLEPTGAEGASASSGHRDAFETGPRDPFAKPPKGTGPPRGPRGQGNPAGVAGFSLSIIGLACCAPVAMVSLIISLLALKREPRGLAIAGVAISIVAFVLNLVFAAIAYFTLSMLGHGSAGAGFELIMDYSTIDVEIQQAGSLPASLDELSLPAERTTDPWGVSYFYEVYPDGGDYKLISLGPDGALGTSDDVQLNPQ